LLPSLSLVMGSIHSGMEDRAQDFPALAQFLRERASNDGAALIITGGFFFCLFFVLFLGCCLFFFVQESLPTSVDGFHRFLDDCR
jgi:hypothetical protein